MIAHVTTSPNKMAAPKEMDPFWELRSVRFKNRSNVVITYLNVNSFRYKFMELGDILYDKLTDICFFAETKLDDTFNQVSFNVPGYKSYRNDRSNSGGGLMTYVCSNLPVRRLTELEMNSPIESIVLDVIINNRRWTMIGAYWCGGQRCCSQK